MGKKSEYAKLFGENGKKIKVKPPKHHDIFMNDISKKKKKKKRKKKNSVDKAEKAIGRIIKEEKKGSDLDELLNLIPISELENSSDIHTFNDLSENYGGLFLVELLLDSSGGEADKGYIMVTVTNDGKILDASSGRNIVDVLTDYYYPGDTENISETDKAIVIDSVYSGNVIESVYVFDMEKMMNAMQIFTDED